VAETDEAVAKLQISVILPSYNEAENLPFVIPELADKLADLFTEWQILVVDDGSTDDTTQVLHRLQDEFPRLRSIRMRRNGGKSEALQAAFDVVDAELIGLMDADGQDDPAELEKLLGAIDDGYDLVTGRRSIRHDRFIKRNTSKVYNWTTAKVSGVDGHDFNSGFKLMRRDVAENLDLYGEMHRYIPPLAEWAGFRSTEVDVNHRERHAGSSKFGAARFWRGFFDLITVKFLTTYDARPFHLIGGAGLLCGFVGTILLIWMGVTWLRGGPIGTRPALLTGIFLVLVSIVLLLVGLLAELTVYESRHTRAMMRRERNRTRDRDIGST
jgi:dolichol-phosphate mannosyltransferase